MKIARVTGFPFHPPADKREDTIHVFSAHSTSDRAWLYRPPDADRAAESSKPVARTMQVVAFTPIE